MPSQESKEIILKYIIERRGKATKNNVVDYMNSKDVPGEFRTSRMTTLDIIDELESDDRINVLKGERKGQSHYLIFNHESEFYQIDQELSKIEKVIDRLPEVVEKTVKTHKGLTRDLSMEIGMWNLLDLLDRTSKIPIEKDAQILYKKIIKLMLTLNYKRNKRFLILQGLISH